MIIIVIIWNVNKVRSVCNIHAVKDTTFSHVFAFKLIELWLIMIVEKKNFW